MLFEEFFKKKKISLDALQQGDPGLFSEFKSHYEQMGEKSFDHTKKFWFNKLRHQYPLPPEVKAEKLRAENQMAEQTVADTLTEPSPRTQAPKLGFTPKFKTPGTLPPVTDTPKTEATSASEASAETTHKPAAYKPRFQAKNVQAKSADDAEVRKTEEKTEAIPGTDANEKAETLPKMGFKPRFKAGVTINKPAEAKEEQPQIESEVEKSADTIEDPQHTEPAPQAKLGFKPRFKAGATTVKPPEENTATLSEKKITEQTEPASEIEAPKDAAAPKLGFKPRFKAGTTTVKPAENADQPEQAIAMQPEEPAIGEPESTAKKVPAAPSKLGFKPRFKAGVTTTKSAETIPLETSGEPEAKVDSEIAEEPIDKPEAPIEGISPKLPYKPRFNPNMVKRTPPKEE